MSKAVAHKETDEPTTLGPAMEALSDKRRNFVMQFVIHGNGAKAARLAGYGGADSSNLTQAKLGYRLRQEPTIQAAITEEVRKYYHSAAAAAVREINRILDDPKAKDADKLRAADGILARIDPIVTGQVMRIEHEHHVHVDHTAAALESLRFLKSMDVPREKLIEQFGYSGLPRYEKMLVEEDIKAGKVKVIEGEVE